MAESSKSKESRDAEAAADRIRALNEQILDFGRDAGVSFLEAYESTLKTVASYQGKMADASQNEWMAAAARAQATLTEEIAKAYASAANALRR